MDTPAKRCFEGVHFGLDLGYGFTLNQKAKFRDLLQAQGGIIDLVFSEQVRSSFSFQNCSRILSCSPCLRPFAVNSKMLFN